MAFYKTMKKSNKKGQISIEFVLLLVVMLVYFNAVIQPILEQAFDSTDDITRLSQTRNAAQKLVNSIDYISLSAGDTEQIIRLFLPRGVTSFKCTPTKVSFTMRLNRAARNTVCDAADGDDATLCTKEFSVVDIPGVSLSCDLGFGPGKPISSFDSQGKLLNLKIRRLPDSVFVKPLT